MDTSRCSELLRELADWCAELCTFFGCLYELGCSVALFDTVSVSLSAMSLCKQGCFALVSIQRERPANTIKFTISQLLYFRW